MSSSDAAQPGRYQFTFPIADIEFDASGAGEGAMTLRGHAAVFDRKSHDLGGFKTIIDKGAFTSVLDTTPDVHLLWDHDTRYVLARTKNQTLELRQDPYGLHVWARLAPTSFAQDLAVLMKRGDVDQMSFACDIGDDTWTETGDEVTRTVHSVSGLYDVTVCAQGAFPQTDSTLLASAREAGRIERPESTVAPETVGGPDLAAETPGAEEVAAETPGIPIAGLQAHARIRTAVNTTRKGNHA